jgi:hypothetical protein
MVITKPVLQMRIRQIQISKFVNDNGNGHKHTNYQIKKGYFQKSTGKWVNMIITVNEQELMRLHQLLNKLINREIEVKLK